MAEQKIRNAYKNFMFKFSPFLNANKNVGSIELMDDKSVEDFSPKRFNFYGQVMESIVNSNPEIVKKVFNTVNLFKYKHDKMEKEIRDIKNRITNENKGKIADMLNVYLPEDRKLHVGDASSVPSGNRSLNAQERVENLSRVLGEKEEVGTTVGDGDGGKQTPNIVASSIQRQTAPTPEDPSKKTATAANDANTVLQNRINDNIYRLNQNRTINEDNVTNAIVAAKTSLQNLLKINPDSIESAKIKQILYGKIFYYEIFKIFNNVTKNKNITNSENEKNFKDIYNQLLLFFKNSSKLYIDKHNNIYSSSGITIIQKSPFETQLRELYFGSTGGLYSNLQANLILITDDISMKTKSSTVDTSNPYIRGKILDCLYSAILFNRENMKEQIMLDVDKPFEKFYKDYANSTTEIKEKTTNNGKIEAISKLLERAIHPSVDQMFGGAPNPQQQAKQQAINSYFDDLELSPNIDKVNLRDRGIFIVLTFIIRAIALFITEWAIYSGFINSFSQSFNMYFGVYLCIFVLILILTNSKNEDITFFNQLFFYINAESEDGKGVIRILLQILCIFFILPIPYMVKDFRMKDKTPNRVLTYIDKSNIYYSVDKFTLFTWILTSIVALSV